MTKHILVTGGAGYIGSILVPELLALGHQVTVVDNFMYGQASLNQLCANPKFNIVTGDVRLESVMAPLIKQADIIIPLAAYVGAPLCNKDPIGATTINHDAILMMLKLISKDQYILMPTTNSAYGSGDENNYCDENSPLNPISRYAKDKVSVEQSLMEHDKAISFRLATVFGMSPRMRTDLLVNDFTYRAVNDKFVVLFEGHFKRNYIHVRDVTQAFLHGIANLNSMSGQIYNVGLSDANVSKMELCIEIQKHIPSFVYLEAPLAKDPDQRNYIVSNDKIEATGFKPKHSLGMGIQELIKGYAMIKNNKYGNI
jgi:nucleoside-diphosphate-sugar epimerase